MNRDQAALQKAGGPQRTKSSTPGRQGVPMMCRRKPKRRTDKESIFQDRQRVSWLSPTIFVSFFDIAATEDQQRVASAAYDSIPAACHILLSPEAILQLSVTLVHWYFQFFIQSSFFM